MKLYHPDGLYVWDTWYWEKDGEVHCAHLQQGIPDQPWRTFETGSLGHAVTKDLLHWKQLPSCLRPANGYAFDAGEIWTGCSVVHENKTWLFYTGHTYTEGIGLAVSEDGILFRRVSDQPVITPDPAYYVSESNPLRVHVHASPFFQDCRDLCVVKDKNGGWWGYYAARVPSDDAACTSVIALCHSDDLVHWEHRPACFQPKKYACIEVPDVFELNGKWWMTVLTGNGYGQRNRMDDPYFTTGTICAVSDSPEGPFVEPEHNTVIGSIRREGFSSRGVTFNGVRYIFWTQTEDTKHLGGISIPSKVEERRGQIVPCWCEPLESLIGENVLDMMGAEPIENTGRWGTPGTWEKTEDGIRAYAAYDWTLRMYDQTAGDFFARFTVEIGTARSAGFVMHAQGDRAADGSFLVLFDADAGEIEFCRLRTFEQIERRRRNIPRNTAFTVKILGFDHNFYVYLEDELVLQLNSLGPASGKFGLFCEQGSAVFRDAGVYQLTE